MESFFYIVNYDYARNNVWEILIHASIYPACLFYSIHSCVYNAGRREMRTLIDKTKRRYRQIVRKPKALVAIKVLAASFFRPTLVFLGT